MALFLGDVETKSRKLSANLSEILNAQQFQDLTGQVIRRVMDDVMSVDDQLRKIATEHAGGAADLLTSNQSVRGRGPVVDPRTEENTVSDQNEVDDILSDLDL